jgi:hypothetical protein
LLVCCRTRQIISGTHLLVHHHDPADRNDVERGIAGKTKTPATPPENITPPIQTNLLRINGRKFIKAILPKNCKKGTWAAPGGRFTVHVVRCIDHEVAGSRDRLNVIVNDTHLVVLFWF